jgi:lysozyme
MFFSENAVEIIKQFEGFRGGAYYCPAGKLTIGYGHLIKPTEKFPDFISEEFACELLNSDLVYLEKGLKKLLNISLNQNQFDALMSFSFNLGLGAFQRSTLRMKVNRGEHYLASQEFLRWVYANKKIQKGLIFRRNLESYLYLSNK